MYEGRLVRLRAVEPEDLEQYYQWMNDPEVTDGLAARYPFSRAVEQEWLAANDKPGFDKAHFAIVTRDGGELIGGCGFHFANAENQSAELGISIGDKTRWHQGYGTDAMRTLCRFGFDEMALHRIELWVHHTNARAQAVYERIGFVFEGRTRQAWRKHGEWRDMIVMGLLRDELRMDD